MVETLVIGGTGAMGSRVVHRLLRSADAAVTVLTRNPHSDKAAELLARGGGRVRVRQGDLDNPESIRAAVANSEQVFCNTDFWSGASVLGEYRKGITALEAARSARVERFVWSSLDSAVTLTSGSIPVPHFDAKAAVAAHINMLRSDETMREADDGWYSTHVSILTTSPYFENLRERLAPRRGPLPDGRSGLTFSLPLGTGRYPLIGLDDIAWFADFMFRNWQSWGARDLAVTADSLTGDEIAATVERVTGTPCRYHAMPPDTLRTTMPGVGHDYAAMFRFFQARDILTLDRNLAHLRALHPEMMTFEDWLRAEKTA
ncbi:NmrA family NAD(P)-binding protein [Nocardia sp. NEAU-G5]|uniref:NmrA family NAD(P)-binding protein n=1 Tax=Nocardia albiluteola TaxID=2842303 RepID=A0ABS6AW52_9NOCA|nr:NmrA family NAD(P)-binding protein [Nocardia albiluteola]MBU3062268.1 NmrA family NAD(P)-binding protein [Nocardia albiluteola]